MSIYAHPGRPGSRGFTLLELLIALSIFGLLSIMAYGGLNSVLTQRAQTDKAAEQLKALQQTYLLMQRDIEQVMPRPVRDEYGQTLRALVDDGLLQLTRGGWSNPLQLPRSSMQRVGYLLEDRQLYRYSWRVLDRAQDSEAVRQPLVENVEFFTLRYLDGDLVWSQGWPPAQSPDAFPKAVEVVIEHERFGPIKWLFQLPV
jgi:general secretion pathway protein J